jgi:hypothetical protein
LPESVYAILDIQWSPGGPKQYALVALKEASPEKENSPKQTSFDIPPDGWSKFSGELSGRMEVRVKNPNDFKVRVGLRSAGHGKDFIVPANETESVRVPNGSYEVFFHYSSDPNGNLSGRRLYLE